MLSKKQTHYAILFDRGDWLEHYLNRTSFVTCTNSFGEIVLQYDANEVKDGYEMEHDIVSMRL